MGQPLFTLKKIRLKMASNKLIIFNFVSFQLLWWLCMYAAKTGLGGAMLCMIALLTLLHVQWIEGWQQALPLLITASTGCIFDQIGYVSGWVTFAYQSAGAAYIPYWMIALWLAFATTLNVSMRWLQHRQLLAAMLGAIFGPLAYLGAQQLGVVGLPLWPQSLIWIAFAWAVALPLLLWIRSRFNQAELINHI